MEEGQEREKLRAIVKTLGGIIHTSDETYLRYTRDLKYGSTVLCI